MLWAEEKICIMSHLIPLILTVILLPCHSGFPTVVDTLYSNQSIHDGHFLISANRTYKLGFFAPNKSSENRYLSLWLINQDYFGRGYNSSEETLIWGNIWVANRDDPLTDTSGVLKFDEVTSNLVLIDTRRNRTLWSTNCTIGSDGNVTAKLQDYGNLVLQNSDGDEIWSSFDDLTSVFLPGAEMSFDLRTKKKNTLTSWKSKWDPSSGPFRFDILLGYTKLPRAYVLNGSKPYFRLGPWIGRSFICVPDMPSSALYRFHLYLNSSESEHVIRFKHLFHYGPQVYIPMWMVLQSDGHLVQSRWDQENKDWKKSWEKPKNKCDSYGFCGKFATCNDHNDPICDCMKEKEFEPQSRVDWEKGNFSGGCVRKKELACDWNANNLTSGDTFVRIKNLKLPDGGSLHSATNESHCKKLCGEDCKCLAYAFVKKQYCLVWKEDLLDMSFIKDGQDLHVKFNPSDESSGGMSIAIEILFYLGCVAVGTIIILCFAIPLLRWRIRRRMQAASKAEEESISCQRRMIEEDQEIADIFQRLGHEARETGLRHYELRVIRTATEDFSLRNKLGEGGFGPVYKGVLSGGQEIAVKRLSRGSTQGLKQFENEVLLISKLQHQNLVRLLGYCVHKDEKLLIYEYLPDGSLDAYLFGALKEKLLDWSKRFNIIEGICRGILYLHRDSRVKVIHQDLKASNILLDADLMPKISDFGTARIFDVNQIIETNTPLGTPGYMAPEYFMHGLVSEKSDVYSFGVLLLVIVSGAKVGTFYDEQNSLDLLGHGWELWEGGNAFNLVDEKLRDSWPYSNALKCIKVALLCVQARASDRPVMSEIFTMLGSDNLDALPSPREPPLLAARCDMRSGPSGGDNQNSTTNGLTITDLEGR